MDSVVVLSSGALAVSAINLAAILKVAYSAGRAVEKIDGLDKRLTRVELKIDRLNGR